MKCYFCHPAERDERGRFVAETGPSYGPSPPFQPPSAIVQQAYRDRVREQTQQMTAGPFLDDDGHTLVVPSEWYSRKAARFWYSKGFEWRPETSTWERDTRKPLDGKRHTPAAWLAATRSRFYRFWPGLLKRCRRCGHRFLPISAYQTRCSKCSP